MRMFLNFTLSPTQGYLERTELLQEVQDVRDSEDTQRNAKQVELLKNEL